MGVARAIGLDEVWAISKDSKRIVNFEIDTGNPAVTISSATLDIMVPGSRQVMSAAATVSGSEVQYTLDLTDSSLTPMNKGGTYEGNFKIAFSNNETTDFPFLIDVAEFYGDV